MPKCVEYDRSYADMTYYFKIPRLLPLASSRDLRFVAAAKPSIVDSLVHSSSIMVGLRVRVFFGCTVRQSENFPYIGQSYMEEAMYLLLSTYHPSSKNHTFLMQCPTDYPSVFRDDLIEEEPLC